jgi:hypothetical protein
MVFIFTSPPLNKCNIKHKLCTLRDNLNVNSLRADKNESFSKACGDHRTSVSLANNNGQQVTLKQK